MMTQRRVIHLMGLAMTAIVAGACTTSTSTSDTGTRRAAMAGPASDNDWPTYHGTYQSWHYSPLAQINTDNVKRLRVAWVHHPGRSTRGTVSPASRARSSTASGNDFPAYSMRKPIAVPCAPQPKQ